MTLKIGFIGLGEVGYSMGKGFKGAGCPQVLAFVSGAHNKPPYSTAFRTRAKEAGVELRDSMESVIRDSDVVFSVVAPAAALSVAREAARFTRPGHFYVDVNSSAPQQKREAARLIEASGAAYIDAIIARDTRKMPHVTVAGHRVHMPIASTSAAAFKKLMEPFGMDLVIIPGPAGNATLAKLVRSLLNKGFMALQWEAALAAWKAGLDVDALKADVFAPAEVSLPRFLAELSADPRHPISGVTHLERRSDEMMECTGMLQEFGVEPIMARAIAQRLKWAKGFRLENAFDGKAPASYRELLSAMEQHARQSSGRS